MAELVFQPKDHIYRLDGRRIPSVTQVLSSNGLVGLDGIPEDVLEQARLRGEDVHESLQYHDEGCYEPDGEEPYLEAWKRFRADKQFEPVLIEQRIHHCNPDYAGTIDRWGTAYGEAGALVDIKTGGKRIADKIQAAGYAAAFRYSFPDRSLTAAWLVYLHPGQGSGYTIEVVGPTEQIRLYGVFGAALTIHNFKEKHNVG